LRARRAGRVRQAQVCNQQRHIVLFEQAQRLFARGGAQHLAGQAEKSFEPSQAGGLTIHDHNLLGHR
jgi:hypothetical protein